MIPNIPGVFASAPEPAQNMDPVIAGIVIDIDHARLARRKREEDVLEYAIGEFRRSRSNENLHPDTIDEDERAVRMMVALTGKPFYMLKEENDLLPFVEGLANDPRRKRRGSNGKILTKAKQFMEFASSDDTLREMVRKEFGETIVQPFKTKIMLSFKGKDDAEKRKAITQQNLNLLWATMKRLIRKAAGEDPRKNVFLPLVRDLVVLFVAYALGLRISEVLELDLDSVGENRFRVSLENKWRAEISNGKGSRGGGKKTKTLSILHNELPALLTLYIEDIRPKLLPPGCEDENILFPSILGKKMGKCNLQHRFPRFLKAAGLEDEHYVVHSLRRAFISHIRMVLPGKVVKELARHGDITITDEYTDFPKEYVAKKCGDFIAHTVAWALFDLHGKK